MFITMDGYCYVIYIEIGGAMDEIYECDGTYEAFSNEVYFALFYLSCDVERIVS